MARAVAAAAERAEAGGSAGSLRISERLTPPQRAALEDLDTSLGSPPGTVLVGGHRYSLRDRELGTAETDDTTEPQPEQPTE